MGKDVSFSDPISRTSDDASVTLESLGWTRNTGDASVSLGGSRSPESTMGGGGGKPGGSSAVRSKRPKSIGRRIFFALLTVVVLAIIAIRYLRPAGPQFTLRDATVHRFNFTRSTSLLTSQFQVTFSSRNPNSRFGIFYDSLDVCASYESQQITFSTDAPAAYQGHKDVDVWSLYLSGFEVQVAPFLGERLEEDIEDDGFLSLWVKINGRIRWKFGSLHFGPYRLFVGCPAYLSFDPRSRAGAGVAPTMKLQQYSECSVDT